MNVYKIRNSVNQKLYIGITKYEISKRFSVHKQRANAKSHGNLKLYNAINKYGIDAFTIELIESVENRDIANEREQYWIKYYDSLENGYNMTAGGFSYVHVVTDITKQRMKDSHWSKKGIINTWTSEQLTGRKLSDEHVQNISIGGKKRYENEDEIRKCSERNSGENNPNFGNKWTDEQRKEASERELNKPELLCPHCGKTGRSGVMYRWHFKNCKRIVNENS